MLKAHSPTDVDIQMAHFRQPRPATVLLVEDELIVQQDIAQWLIEQGLEVLTADSADEAINLLNRHAEVEFLLTDIQMPGSMDGIRLAHYVAERWPPIRIIVLSSLFTTAISELPAHSFFVPKPYIPEVLLGAIRASTASA